MLAWIIASKNPYHWQKIEGALDRHHSQQKLSAVIIDPWQGPAATQARNWARRKKIPLTRKGQPDIIFLCHSKLWEPEITLALQEKFQPEQISGISISGNIFRITPGQQPHKPEHTWREQLRRRAKKNRKKAARAAL